MEHWLYPANTKYYDVLGAFGEKETYWPVNSKVSVGDVLYIYLAAPYKQIGFVCEVLEIGYDAEDIMDEVSAFIKKSDSGKKHTKPFMKVKVSSAVEIKEDSPVNYYYLKENGLNGMLMGPRKLENNPPLLKYIQENLA
ncbi:hypothetical protein J2755_000992 [Methanohalophilus levihalophilus]|uniref:hypothetical protein n=1 Tax=Methanohalophilus levihalophilus TaxID=1431282 RepID=UPI001AE3569C|nr:hypothetical protein [Methanohalophilus levihalophilus]MBP2030058.1 hypothetical protein [Methanohalophilus levihalophilus]